MKTVVKGLLAYLLLGVLSAIFVRWRFREFGEPHDNEFALVAAMEGRHFMSVADGLRSGSALAYIGGIELDLTEATPVDGATISLTAIMGGMDVVVPATWRVELAANAALGGVANLTDPDRNPDGPLVVFDARVVLGGIEIHEVRASDGS